MSKGQQSCPFRTGYLSPLFTSMPILSLLIFLPLIGCLLLLAVPRPKEGTPLELEPGKPLPKVGLNAVSIGAILIAALNFLAAVSLFIGFDLSYTNPKLAGIGQHLQKVENYPWIRLGSSFEVFYHLGVDGVSLLLILLTTFVTLLSVIYSAHTVKSRLKEMMICLLALESAVIGVFCSLDLMLFYFFWEGALIPAYFLVGVFGSERRVAAALKFFLFTFAGSILMLVGIVAIYGATGTFNLIELTEPGSIAAKALHMMDGRMLGFCFWSLALAFLIKIHIFPVHTWLPDTYTEAPTGGSMMLSGVMLKMGSYGLIRFCLPLFPAQARESANIMIALAIISILYGAIIAAVQTDIKRWIAYSSMSHLGFILLGIFSFTKLGMMGALIQNINHGISTPMLFLLLGMLIERRGSREFKEYGGLKLVVPALAAFLLLGTLSSIAVPFFNGFVGEFTILLGSWTSLASGFVPTAIAATGMVFSSVYMLWGFQKIMLGPVTKPSNRTLPDLRPFEWAVLLPLTSLIFWIGMFSHFWTQRMDLSVNALLAPAPRGIGEFTNDDLPAVAALQKADLQQYRQDNPVKPEPSRETEPPLHRESRGGSMGKGMTGGKPIPNGTPTPQPLSAPSGAQTPKAVSPGASLPPAEPAPTNQPNSTTSPAPEGKR